MLKFTALVDLPPHITERTRREMSMQREMTAEEMIKAFNDGTYWQSYVPRYPRKPTVYAPISPDDVDERREEEKRLADFSASHGANIPSWAEREEMLADGMEFMLEETLADHLQSFQITLRHHICEDRKFTAMMLKADPHQMVWNRIVEGLSKRELLALIRECQKKSIPEVAWNNAILAMEPQGPSPFQVSNGKPLDEPWRPQISLCGLGYIPKPLVFTREEVEGWMAKAEAHELDDKITRCLYSGRSLVEVRKGVRRTWRIAPNWHGMGLKMAREAVSWAAIEAGLADGYQVGEPPPPVKALAMDGSAWAALAVTTRHPTFYDTGRFLLMLQDILYFKLEGAEMRANLRAWERVAANAAKEEASE